MDFTKLNGLIPAIAQDDESGEVLMVGFMNEEALNLTLSSGYATFYSRSRQKLWLKGESSGNRLAVRSVLTDCDNDSVVMRVVRLGDGLVCHEGTRSCFTKELFTRTDGGAR
jgi:phosphoribosyl-ATP pyrophosphohydrolase/phosphoribosyl-AMP cyclohydrolase